MAERERESLIRRPRYITASRNYSFLRIFKAVYTAVVVVL